VGQLGREKESVIDNKKKKSVKRGRRAQIFRRASRARELPTKTKIGNPEKSPGNQRKSLKNFERKEGLTTRPNYM